MKATLTQNGKTYLADLADPIDLSIPLRSGTEGVNCFYAPPVEFWPVRTDGFIGSTKEGGALNFFNIKLNPHGNGTHTECVGHIAGAPFTINQALTAFHYFAKLVSVFPRKLEDGDRVITKSQLEGLIEKGEAPAFILRTLPNDDWKKRTNYSGSNPPYIEAAGLAYLADCGVEHLLLDLPSVDREEDGSALAGHKAFWRYPGQTREKATISELIFVNNSVPDGYYLLNLQIVSLELDVSPGKPVIYRLERTD